MSASGVLEGVAHAARRQNTIQAVREQVTAFANDVRLEQQDEDALAVEPDELRRDDDDDEEPMQQLDYFSVLLALAWAPAAAAGALVAMGRRPQSSRADMRVCIASACLAAFAYAYARRYHDLEVPNDIENTVLLGTMVFATASAIGHGAKVILHGTNDNDNAASAAAYTPPSDL